MILAFCKNKTAARALLQSGCPVANEVDGNDIRCFTHDGAQGSFPVQADEVAHLLTPLPDQAAGSAVLHESLPLFKSSWSKAFIEHVADAIDDQGTIDLPCPKESTAPVFHEEDLVKILGPPLSTLDIEGKPYFRFRALARTKTDSSLRWSVDQQDALRADEMDRAGLITKFMPESMSSTLEPMLAEGCSIQPPDSSLHAAVELDRSKELFAYFHAAVAPKIALMRSLANSIATGGKLHHVDIGGGMGNLGAELILDSTCRIASSTNVEFDAARLIMAKSLHDTYEPQLGGNWNFWTGFAQDHPFDERADFITALGALLYVPREHLTSCLQRAWGALNPGGLFVIYEHIKHPRFTRDFDSMFEKEELESILGQLGDFRCFSGSSLKEMPNDSVEQKSVYRVLQRPN